MTASESEQELPLFSDTALLRRYRDGSQEAARLLYQRYAERLRALARASCSAKIASRIDADDIVQSVFRRFFQAVDRGNYDLPSGQDFWSLLMVIALNRIRVEEVFHRAAKRDVRRTVGIDAEPASDPPASEVAPSLVKMIVDEALGRLPEHYRDVVRFRVEGYEVGEIAQLTRRSKRTVERILQNARDQLRTWLDEDDADERPADGPPLADD